MTKRQLIAVLFFVSATILGGIWWLGRPSLDPQQPAEQSEPAKRPSTPVLESAVQRTPQALDRRTPPEGPKMSDLEFKRLKINLPTPVNEPWKGPFFDSKSCFDPDKKQAAVEVLPTWIRQAMLGGKPEMAARFFWSLTKLAEDKEAAIATQAVFAIYRMGDYKGVAAEKMRGWIESGVDVRYSDSISGSSESRDVRSQVLEELALNNDPGLLQLIYNTWLRTKAEDGETLASVDYAYYLEKHGRELPADYWLERLDNPNGFANALEVAQSKGMPQVTAKLQTLFEELRSKPAANADSARAARVASALFRQTGDARYRDYLIEQAQPQLASGSFENSVPSTLEGLAATNDKAALDVVSSAMQNENVVIREMAIDALGKTRDPAATELLFQAALQKTKQGTGFPAREMRALLAQNDPAADAKYEQLQQALLGGQLGWSATTSDFQTLEFFRKHGR